MNVNRLFVSVYTHKNLSEPEAVIGPDAGYNREILVERVEEMVDDVEKGEMTNHILNENELAEFVDEKVDY